SQAASWPTIMTSCTLRLPLARRRRPRTLPSGSGREGGSSACMRFSLSSLTPVVLALTVAIAASLAGYAIGEFDASIQRNLTCADGSSSRGAVIPCRACLFLHGPAACKRASSLSQRRILLHLAH